MLVEWLFLKYILEAQQCHLISCIIITTLSILQAEKVALIFGFASSFAK